MMILFFIYYFYFYLIQNYIIIIMSSNNQINSSDVFNIINNLVTSFETVNNNFNSIQSSFTSLNNYDNTNNTYIKNITNKNNQQNLVLTLLNDTNNSDIKRLSLLESKFPLNDFDFNIESIDKIKINSINNDLFNINSNIADNLINITTTQTNHNNKFTSFQNNINSQTNKRINDYNTYTTNFNTFTSSTTGSQNNLQQQLDSAVSIINTNLTTKNNNNDNLVNSLNTTKLDLNNRMNLLETDNTNIKQSILNNSNNIILNTTNLLNLTNIYNDTINDYNYTENQLTSDIASLNISLTATNNTYISNMLSVNTLYDNLNNKVTNNNNIIDGKINTLTTSENNTKTSIQTSMNTLDNKIDSDYSNLNNKIITNTTTQTNNKNTITAQLDTLNNTFINHFVSLENNILLNTNNISSNLNEINLLKSRSNILENSINTTNSNITNFNNNKDNFLTSINNQSIEISSLQDDNTIIKTDITNISNDITNIQLYDTQNNTNLTTITQNVTQVHNDIIDLNNSIIPNLDTKLLRDTSDSVTFLNVKYIDSNNNLSMGSSSNNIILGSSSNLDAKSITIGGPTDNVTIRGNVTYLQHINTDIQDKIIQMNKSSDNNNSSGECGIQIRESNNDNSGYIKTNSNGTGFELKPPNSTHIYKIKESVSEPQDILNYLYLQLHSTDFITSILDVTLDTIEFGSQLTQINSQLIDSFPFSRLENFNSTTDKLLLGDGTFSKLNITSIDPKSLNTDKFLLPNDSTLILHGDGTFKRYSSIESHLRLNNIINDNDINIQNYKIRKMSNGTDNQDLLNLQQMTSLIPQLFFDTTTLRLNTISTNNHISFNNHKLINLFNSVNNKDMSNIVSYKTVLSDLDNYITQKSVNYSKMNITGDGSRFLASDGQYKTFFDYDTLYEFLGFTFNDCGCNGRYGPTLTKMRNNYSIFPWTQNSNFLTIDNNKPGVQIWTVPKTGCYQFEIAGPSGGYSYQKSSGGKGRIVTGLLNLTQGQKLKILVGQRGKTTIYRTPDEKIYSISGGSGATYVLQEDDTPLFVAGAGGSAINDIKHNYFNNGIDAPVSYIGNGNIFNNINNSNTSLYNNSISSSGYNQMACYGSYTNTASFLGSNYLNGGIGGKGFYGTATPNTSLSFINNTNIILTNNIVWQLFYSNTNLDFSSIQITTTTNTTPSTFKIYYTRAFNKDSLDFSSSTINNINYILDGFINNTQQLQCHFNNINIPSGYYFMIGLIGGENTFKKFNQSNYSYLLSNNTNSVLFTMLNYSYFIANNNSLDINSNVTIPSQLQGTGTYNLLNKNILAITLGKYQLYDYNTINATLTNNNVITADGGFGGGSAALVYDNLFSLSPSSAGYIAGFSGMIDLTNNIYTNNYSGAGGSYWNNNIVVYGGYGPKNNDTFGYVKVLLYSINSIIDNSVQNNYILSQQELDMIAYCLVHILYIVTIIGLYKINIMYFCYLSIL